jgi:6-phosphogluconate dehydrogenase
MTISTCDRQTQNFERCRISRAKGFRQCQQQSAQQQNDSPAGGVTQVYKTGSIVVFKIMYEFNKSKNNTISKITKN